MLNHFLIFTLCILKVWSQNTMPPFPPIPPVEPSTDTDDQSSTQRVQCTTDAINNFLDVGSTYVPDVLKCTDKMKNLGQDFLISMNDFYNYNFDSFRNDFQQRSQCDKGLCTFSDVNYLLSFLLRLRAQMYDMLDIIKYNDTMPKSTKTCLNQVMQAFTDAASNAIACPA